MASELETTPVFEQCCYLLPVVNSLTCREMTATGGKKCLIYPIVHLLYTAQPSESEDGRKRTLLLEKLLSYVSQWEFYLNFSFSLLVRTTPAKKLFAKW